MATRAELYEKFGVTAEAGQLLETALITCIIALEGLDRGWIEDPEPILGAEILGKLDSIPMGALHKQLKKHLNIDGEEISFLGNSLETRNRLNHGFYLKHSFKIDSPEGRDEMIADLEEKHQILFDAWQMTTHLSDILLAALQLLKRAHEEKRSE